MSTLKARLDETRWERHMATKEALDVGTPCTKRWSDETGCTVAAEHSCIRVGEHATHWCDCGAVVIETEFGGQGEQEE